MRAFVFVVASGLVVALCGNVRAAELPAPEYKAAPDVAAPVPYDWSGYHVGGNVGYSWGRADTAFAVTNFPLAPISTTMNGWVAGAQVGRDWQLSKIVLGIESDIEATGQRGASGVGPSTVCPPRIRTCLTGSGTLDEKLPWLVTLRGRLGVTPMDRLLVYDWTAKVEVLRLDLENAYKAVSGPNGLASGTASNRVTDNIARIGANYRFDLPALAFASQ